MEPVELLKQNLAIEPDLQNFIGFVLECVNRLGGNPFSSSIASLDLMQKLRNAGAATGFPLPASLQLQGHQLLVHWGEHSESLRISNLAKPPKQEAVAQLRRHLQDSTASADPAILLQRNAEMARHLDETRARTEKELEALQQTLEKRQTELYESLRQAETDPLTGLFNRRAFDDKLGQAFRHTMRQKASPLSLALFDLDHFKQINDEFGHQFGDAYLNKMAHALRCAIREDVDFAFRFGGDEFAMVIFADHRQACLKAKQVLDLMENKVSIGITSINPNTPDGLSLEEFIHRADKALYEAKRRGRGRAVVDVCPLPDGADCQFPCP
ncbi:MAG: GGDEF domain-containing protein [Betaproteobacteria bacterium]